jgi:hypothetical protein
MFDAEKDIPNPLVNFPGFISRVYSIRDVLNPQNTTHSMHLIERFGFHDPAHFVLYQCPPFLFDPILYLETLLCLRHRRHQLWSSFATSPPLVDSFVQLYATFVTPLGARTGVDGWRHRFLMTELLADALFDVSSFHSEIAALALQFFELCIPLLAHARLEPAIQLLRPILSSIRFFSHQVSRESISPHTCLLLEILDRDDSPHFPAVVRSLLTIRPSVISHEAICHLICTRGIRSIADFDVLSLACDAIAITSVLPFLARTSISSKVWHRACFGLLKEFAEKFSLRADIREWFFVLIRRLFIFVAVAAARAKYRCRTLMICESLASLRTCAPWIQQALITSASTVVTKSVPVYFRAMFPISPTSIEEVAMKELMVFGKIGRCLKAFPFDPQRRAFLAAPRDEKTVVQVPVNARSPCRRIQCASAPAVSALLEKKKRMEKKVKKRRLILTKRTSEGVVEQPVSVPVTSQVSSARGKR